MAWKVHTDGGLKIKNAMEYQENISVVPSLTMSFKPASNLYAKRAHQLVSDVVQTALIHQKLPVRLWNYAVRHAIDSKSFARGNPYKS